jgi:hypothetical protein
VCGEHLPSRAAYGVSDKPRAAQWSTCGPTYRGLPEIFPGKATFGDLDAIEPVSVPRRQLQ